MEKGKKRPWKRRPGEVRRFLCTAPASSLHSPLLLLGVRHVAAEVLETGDDVLDEMTVVAESQMRRRPLAEAEGLAISIPSSSPIPHSPTSWLSP